MLELFTTSIGTQTSLLLLSFLLCGIVGIERQYRQKSSGFRTHVLVGMGSCTFTLVGAFGFSEFSLPHITVDPGRIAAQIVTGIGFLGAGVILKRRDTVTGLTTAATIWVTAAIGMACGSGMVLVAGLLTMLHLVSLVALPPLLKKLPTVTRQPILEVTYADGRGVLRDIVEIATEQQLALQVLSSRRVESDTKPLVDMRMRFTGKNSLDVLVHHLQEVDGIVSMKVEDDDDLEGQ